MQSDLRNIAIDKALYIRHIFIILVGFIIGLVTAYFFSCIPFDFSAELDKAKELGIMSVSIYYGYPKNKDLLLYLSLLGFPLFFSLLPWYIWARNKKSTLMDMFTVPAEQLPNKNKKWMPFVLVFILFYIFISFNINRMYTPGCNPFVGCWIFLGEDGENLAWAQSILSGGVYGKDFFCLYGPMLIYPLVWAMKLFGTTVIVERGLKYFYDLLSYGIVIFFLSKTIRWRFLFIIAGVAYIFIFASIPTISINTTDLRFILGILPFLLIYIYLHDSKKKYLLILVGIALGQSILFSQEAGICSLIVSIVMLSLYTISTKEWTGFFRHSLLLIGGIVISVAPMLIHLILNNAFPSFFDSIYGFPRLKTLGYGGYPFPAFKGFISSPLKYLYAYWMILFYAIMLAYLFSLFLLKVNDRTVLLKISILLYGILLFVIPLGRPYVSSFTKVFHPSVLLLFLYLDSAITIFIKNRDYLIKLGHAVLATFLVVTLSLVFFNTPSMVAIKDTLDEIKNSSAKWNLMVYGIKIPNIERGGIFFYPGIARSILEIKSFLDTYAKNETFIYFFPNEAAYYFLFDKQNPTRYAIAYFAITTKQRMELISDLEKHKTKFIIYSRNTWRVDNINEFIQVPEVVNYIIKNYRVFEDKGDVIFLERKT
jgi:hypothetical protein